MTEVYLCRHGRTVLNANGLLRGRCDPELDEVGLVEADALADSLADVRFARVIASPLLRAVETAQPLAAASGVRVETDHRLIDIDYGAFKGTPAAPLIARYGDATAAPGVEPVDEVARRALACLHSLADRHESDATGSGPAPRPVALVSHDVVIRILCAALFADQPPVELATGGWLRLSYEGCRWLLVDSSDGAQGRERGHGSAATGGLGEPVGQLGRP